MALLSVLALSAADRSAQASAPPPKELRSLWTATSRTVENADGSRTASLYAGRVNFRDSGGEWQPIDASLVPSNTDGYPLQTKANSFRALFKDKLDDGYLRFDVDGYPYVMSLEGAAHSASRASARKVSYGGVFDGVDLRYDTENSGIEETIVLNDRQGPGQFHFTLTPPAPAELHPQRLRDGSWIFRNAASGEVLFGLAAPTVAEAGSGPSHEHVSLDVKPEGRKLSIDLAVDPQWLHAPERAFPIRIDPTITVQPALLEGNWEMPCSYEPCTAMPGPHWIGNDGSSTYRSTFKFDLGDLPPNASVTNASLGLWYDNQSCLELTCNQTTHPLELHRVTSSWNTNSTSSSQIGWDSANTLATYSISPGGASRWMNFPLTTAAQNWASGAWANNGVLLKRTTEGKNAGGPTIPGNEDTEGHQPRLDVTYSADGVKLYQPDTVHGNGAELEWTKFDGSTGHAFSRYEVHRSTSPNFTPSAATLIATIGDVNQTSYRDTTAAPNASFTYEIVVNGNAASWPRTVTTPAAGTAQKTLQPVPASGKATYIENDTSGTDCSNYGGSDRIEVGADSWYTEHGLIAFALGDLPTGAQVQSATLSLYMDSAPIDAATVEVHRVNSAWTEGTGTWDCTNDGATWTDAQPGVPWTTAGGDQDSVVTAAKTHSPTDPAGWDDFGVAPLVQQWVDGARSNQGFLLRTSDESHTKDTTVGYVSDDETVAPSLRPRLTVVYADNSTSNGPVVSLSAPAPNSNVRGTAVPVTAAATDDQGVTKVDFFADGSPIGSATTAPFSIAWNSTQTADGSRVLTAKAYDAVGNVSTSTGVTVTVDNSAPPTTSITSVVPSYVPEVKVDRPLGYWRLGETSGGSAVDASGNGNSGTYDNAKLGAAGALANSSDTAVDLNGAPTASAPSGAPANDNFAAAQAITGASGTATGWNVGATKQTGEPNHAGDPGGASVWYTWTPATTGSATIDTVGSTFDTTLGVYKGTAVNALTTVASDDDSGGAGTSQLTFSATAGVVYRIAVDGYGGATGAITLDWQLGTITMTNNAFASGIALTGAGGTSFGTNVGATKETGEPQHAGNAGGKSVWWSWTAPTDGSATITTDGSAFDTLLAVYTGGAVNALTAVASNDDDVSGMTSSVTFAVVAGTTYRIAVDGYNSGSGGAASGRIMLKWSLPPLQSVDLGDRFDFNGTAPFSIETWVKPQTIDSIQRRIVSKESGSGATRQGYDLWLSTAGLGFERVRDGASDAVTSTAGLKSGVWSHVAATYDGTTMRLYVNGVLVGSAASAKQLLDRTTSLRLGRNAGTQSQPFVGQLDEAAVYGSALSAARVKAHDDAGLGASTTTVHGTAMLNASAADDHAVTKVEFYVDSLLISTDTSAPYSATWDTLDPEQPTYDGAHVLTTKAYDAGGQVTTSTAYNVTVANTANSEYQSTFSSTQMPQDATYDPTATTQDKVGVDVTVTNTSGQTWTTNDVVLRYRWASPDAKSSSEFQYTDGPDVPLAANVAPGQSTTVTVKADPPALPAGVNKAQYDLRVDAFSKTNGTYFAAQGNKPLENPVIVDRDLVRGALGLERYFHYVGDELGGGMQHLVNVANGNSIVRFTPFDAPGRGLNSVVDLTYNSLEKKCECPAGNNWSLAISSLTRFGNPLDVHPNKADTIGGNPNRFIEFTDGDGTTLDFTSSDGVHWQEPPGVNLYLRKYSDTDTTKKWALTRPDRVTFFYDTDGFPTSVQDANGNTITYTLENTPPGEDPGGPAKRVTKVTDAGGRSFLIDYYSKDEAKKAHVRGRVQTITDHTGHVVEFLYYDDGNLRKLVEHGGTNADGSFLADRSWVFTYTTSPGNGPALPDPQPADPPEKVGDQSTRLYSIRDPRGHLTTFTYLGSGNGIDRWKLASRTDRATAKTTFDYDTTNQVTTVTEPLDRSSKYSYDTEGKVTKITNPLGQQTSLDWSTDRAVSKVTEPSGSYIQYAYDANGYLTDQWVLTQKTPQQISHTQLVYDHIPVDSNDATGHISQLAKKIEPLGDPNPAGHQWTFGHDGNGNVTSVTDPDNGTTRYTFTKRTDGSVDGTVATVEDANSVAKGAGLTTKFTNYDANGFPQTVTDPLSNVTRASFDDSGLLQWMQDPEHDGKPTDASNRVSFYYDSFHRLGRQSAPKSSADEPGQLVWSDAGYDPNDNLVATYKPHYGTNDTLTGVPVTRTTYDAVDQPDLVSAPNPAGGTATADTDYQFDPAGRLTSITAPRGTATPNIAKDWEVDYGYDKLDRLTTTTQYDVNATGGIDRTLTTTNCYDLAGDLRSVSDPKAGAVTCPAANDPYTPTGAAFTKLYEYDAAHRPVKETDPARSQSQPGLTRLTSYDADGNAVKGTNEEGTLTTTDFNGRDMPTIVKTPLSPTHTIVEQTKYDAVGNTIKQISPRAYDAASDKTNITNYVTSYDYDADNQLVKVTLPVDGTSTDTQSYVHNAYDRDGRLKWMSIPATSPTPGGVLPENKTEYTYFDTGWIHSSINPGNRSKTPTIKFDYLADGSQACRAVVGKGVCATSRDAVTGDATFWDYNNASLVQRITDLGDDNGGGQFSTYTYDENGQLKQADEKRGHVNAGQFDSTIKTSYDTLGETVKVSEKKSNATNWTFTKFGFDDNGNLLTREDDGKEDDAGNVVTAGRKHTFTYDGADWLQTQLDQGKSTGCADDQRITNDFTKLGLEQKRVLEAAQTDCSWKTKQTTRWSYFQNGKLDKLRIWNGAVNDNADITQVTPQAGVSLKESHDVSYLDPNGVYVDGNRTSDTMKVDGPNSACHDATCKAEYTYDARDKVTKEVNGHGGTSTYDIDAHGNLRSQTKDGVTTTYQYDGDQLQSATTAGKTQSYWYDDRGRVDCITIGGSRTDCNKDNDPATVVADYAYDYLDRLSTSKQFLTDGTTSYKDRTSSYIYDALSRIASENEHHWRYPNGANGDPNPAAGLTKQTDRTTNNAFLGLTNLVSQETITGGDSKQKDYLYDAYGHRVGLTDTRAGGAAKQYTYGDDVHGSVQLLLDEAGKAQASYGYTAYGDADKALTKENNPDYDPSVTDPKDDRSSPTTPADDPLNAYRYAGKRFDTGAGDIDMGARHFGPGERFLQPDQFQDALGDLDLATDPLTGNRYALAGGNPLSFVEVDGHMLMADGGGGAGPTPTPHKSHHDHHSSSFLGGVTSALSGGANFVKSGAHTVEHAAVGVGKSAYGTAHSLIWDKNNPCAAVNIFSSHDDWVCTKAMGKSFKDQGVQIGKDLASNDPKRNLRGLANVCLLVCTLPLGGEGDAAEAGVAGSRAAVTAGRAAEEGGEAGAAGARGAASSGGRVFSGHGGLERGARETTVPKGTCVKMYCAHGETITDTRGNSIEMGRPPAPTQVYGPGERIPNYTLFPPEGLNIFGNPFTVTEPTRLSELLRPNMGVCHWAACRTAP